jgi:hypothetical protein
VKGPVASTLINVVVAALVAVLALGAGLGGFVHAWGGSAAHVCTCASGGTHATCPVCNPRLHEGLRSSVPAFDGAPCGDPKSALDVALQSGVLPAPWLALPPALELSTATLALDSVVEAPFLEPAIPPPRRTTV